MSWSIVALIVCVLVIVSIPVFRQIRRRRNTSSRTSSGSEPAIWTWAERASWLCGIVSAVVAVWPLAASLLGTTQAGSATPASSTNPASARSVNGPEPEVLLRKDVFPLGPPSAFPREETDKIDLDTGERGYGKIVEDFGADLQPDDGGRADLFIEETSVHAFSDSDRKLVVLKADEPATYASCSGGLADDARRVARIPLDDIDSGTRLCVQTDKGRAALVTVLRESDGPVLTIAYTTWEARRR
ncbi:MAG: hypothetical protein HOW59_19905 [Nonomuraea sp.]|nr:hypothetical protein [Nonomuraea sp.]